MKDLSPVKTEMAGKVAGNVAGLGPLLRGCTRDVKYYLKNSVPTRAGMGSFLIF